MRRFYTYENFPDIDLKSVSYLVLICGIYAGILLGVLFAMIYRINSHRVVSALAERGAEDRESALTLAEIGLDKKRFVRGLLKTDGSLRGVVRCANESEFPERKVSAVRRFWREKILRSPLPPRTDFSIARFYIPEEKRISAELRFTPEKHPVRTFVLAAVGLLALAVFTVTVLPQLLAMADSLITQVKPQSNYY